MNGQGHWGDLRGSSGQVAQQVDVDQVGRHRPPAARDGHEHEPSRDQVMKSALRGAVTDPDGAGDPAHPALYRDRAAGMPQEQLQDHASLQSHAGGNYFK